MNLAKTIWWWQLGWRDGWTPDSTTKFGCDVNIKSIYEEEFSNKWVGSLIHIISLIHVISVGEDNKNQDIVKVVILENNLFFPKW